MGCGAGAPERFESIEQLDAQLVTVVRQEVGLQLRLRLGQVLEVMQQGGLLGARLLLARRVCARAACAACALG